MIWTKDQKKVIFSHLSLFSEAEKVLYAWIPKDIDPHQFMDELAQAGTKDCFFSVSLMTANIFFKARFIGSDAGGFRFEIPEKIFKVQRRKDVRFAIPPGHVVRVEFDDPLFPEKRYSKKIIDLSAGGLAFIADPSEDLVFQAGMILKNITFSVKNKTFKVEAEVRHKRLLPDNSSTKGLKVGLQFKDLRAGENQLIAQYIFEESRKFYARFIT